MGEQEVVKNDERRSPGVQLVKDPALSLLWLGRQLWRGFNPWPQNFCLPWAHPPNDGRSRRGREKEGQ